MKQIKKVAIQGIAGANHEIAAREFFSDYDVEIIPNQSFSDLFQCVIDDESVYGIVAIENTLVGSIQSNYSLLRDSHLTIIGECKLRIVHNLMALDGVNISGLTEVHSHPMALAQCEDFFKKYPHIKLVEADDTASAARDVALNMQRNVGAIAPTSAAQLYGLNIIERGIETNKKNYTRFLVVTSRGRIEEEALLRENKIDKASVYFTLSQSGEVGSLSKVLSILAFYGINLTKIQSNPVVGHAWEYDFYIDLTFNVYSRYIQALDAIRPLCGYLSVLGEYKSY